jgi:hypothetical protein
MRSTTCSLLWNAFIVSSLMLAGAAHAATLSVCDYLDRGSVAQVAGRSVDQPVARFSDYGTDGSSVQSCDWKVEGRQVGVFVLSVRTAPDRTKNAQDIRQMQAAIPHTHPKVRIKEVGGLGEFAEYRTSVDHNQASLVVMQDNVMVNISAWQLPVGAEHLAAMTAMARKVLQKEEQRAQVEAAQVGTAAASLASVILR